MTRNRPSLAPSRESIAVERLLCAARSPRKHRERLNVLRLALMGERSLTRLADAGDMSRTSVAGCLAAWRVGGFAKLLDCSVVARLPQRVVEAFREGLTRHQWQSVSETREWLKEEYGISVPLRALRYWMIVETAGASFTSSRPLHQEMSADAPSQRIQLPGNRAITSPVPVSLRDRVTTLAMPALVR
jgi:hypothetical protein